MDETASKRIEPEAFPEITKGSRARQESPDEGPSFAATSTTVNLSRNANDNRIGESTLRVQRLTQLTNAFMSEMASRANMVGSQPEPIEQGNKVSQPQHTSSMANEPTSIELVRSTLGKQLRYIEGLEESEKYSKKHRQAWPRNVQVLLNAVELLQKLETAQTLVDGQVKIPSPIPEPQLSEAAQRIAKLTPLDRELLRQAGEKYLILVKRRKQEAIDKWTVLAIG